jgi:hypothetical protein
MCQWLPARWGWQGMGMFELLMHMTPRMPYFPINRVKNVSLRLSVEPDLTMMTCSILVSMLKLTLVKLFTNLVFNLLLVRHLHFTLPISFSRQNLDGGVDLVIEFCGGIDQKCRD